MQNLLFPAYAGVILDEITDAALITAFPRIRGGDPLTMHCYFKSTLFSPHTRG